MQYSTNYGLKKPQYADNADIADLNDNTDDIDELIHQNRLMFAPAYDSTETYNVGDIVVYLGAAYKCNMDGTTGAWDASKWDATDMATEIAAAAGNVEANPSETATDTLKKVKIGGTVYETGIDYLTVNNGMVCAVYEE